MTSVLNVDTIAAKDGTSPATLTKQSAAKMWANANNSHVIQNSFNVSSLTDGGTGNYTWAMNNSMSDADYCYLGICGNTTNDDGFWAGGTPTTSSYFVRCRTYNGNLNDVGEACTAVQGDLA